MAVLCPVPSCSGQIINNECNRCGAFSYIGGGQQGAIPSDMPVVMSADEWKFHTAMGVLRRRSGSLRAVDKALKDYEAGHDQRSLDALKQAFEKHLRERGGLNGESLSRRHEGRNRLGAYNVLADQIAGKKIVIEADSTAALQVIDEQSKVYLDLLFRGSRVDFPGKNMMVASSLNEVKKIRSMSAPLATGAAQQQYAVDDRKANERALNIIREIFGNPNSPEVNQAIQDTVGTSVQDLARTMAVGIKLLPNTVKVFKAGWSLKGTIDRASTASRAQNIGSVSGKAGEAAVDAVIVLMNREIKSNTTELGAATAQLGGAVGDLFTGGVSGVATDIAAKLTRLVRDLIILKIDLDEKNAANEYLGRLTQHTGKDPFLTYEIFEKAPLLGAYLVLAADDNYLFGGLFNERFGQPGWKMHFEYLKRKYNEPLMKATRTCIGSHKMRLCGKPIPKLTVVSDAEPTSLLAVRDPGTVDRMKMRWDKFKEKNSPF